MSQPNFGEHAARRPLPKDAFALIGGYGSSNIIQDSAHYLTRLGPSVTPFGPSAALYRVRIKDAHFLFLPRHGDSDAETAAPWINYRANVYALKAAGVERIIAWSGASAINLSLSVGGYILPHDLVDDTRGRESSFFKGKALGELRQFPVFCDEMRAVVETTLHRLNLDHVSQGTYACTQGPRRETPAEVKRLRSWGADITGMTLAPEVFLARELEICYVPLCFITGYGEGIKRRQEALRVGLEGALVEAERKALDSAVDQMLTIAAYVSRAVADHRTCLCASAMDDYRKKKLIEEDWRTWVGRP